MNLKERLYDMADIVPGVVALLLLCTALVFMGLAWHEHREAVDTWKEVARTWQNVDKQLREMECEKKLGGE